MFDQQYRSTERSEEHKAFGSAGEERGREVQPVTESLCRNPEPSGEARKDLATDLEGSVGTDSAAFTMQVRCGKPGGGKGPLIQVDKSATLSTCNVQTLFQPVEMVSIEGNGSRPSHNSDGYSATDKSYTLNATEVHGVAYKEPIAADVFNQSINTNTFGTVTAGGNTNDGSAPKVIIPEPICFEPGIKSRVGGHTGTICSTLRANVNDNS